METVLLSLTKSDFQDLIAETVNSCLRRNMPTITSTTSPQDELLTVPQAANFLSLTISTIYGLTHRGEIPCMKRSKRVYFSKADLMGYLKAGKKKTTADYQKEADQYLTSK